MIQLIKIKNITINDRRQTMQVFAMKTTKIKMKEILAQNS